MYVKYILKLVFQQNKLYYTLTNVLYEQYNVYFL